VTVVQLEPYLDETRSRSRDLTPRCPEPFCSVHAGRLGVFFCPQDFAFRCAECWGVASGGELPLARVREFKRLEGTP
jgi:hypothetical protein